MTFAHQTPLKTVKNERLDTDEATINLTMEAQTPKGNHMISSVRDQPNVKVVINRNLGEKS